MKLIDTIVTHGNPHSDELLAIILLQRFGRLRFPGVEKAKICFSICGSKTREARNRKENDGTLFIGVGEGMFDEHNRRNNQQVCAATLVAEHLKLLHHRPLQKILKQTLNEDRNGAQWKNEVPTIVKIMYVAGISFEEVLKWYATAFWAEYAHEEKIAKLEQHQNDVVWDERVKNSRHTTLDDAYLFISEHNGPAAADAWKAVAESALAKRQALFETSKTLFQKKAQMFFWHTEFGRLKIAYVESDLPLMNAVGIHLGVDLLVLKNSSGNMQIFTNKKKSISLQRLAGALRFAEAKKRKLWIKNMNLLEMEGTFSEVPQWHLLEKWHSMLFNGSNTAQAVEPTVLTLEEILGLVKKTLGCRPPQQAPGLANFGKALEKTQT